ncbi:MAG: hypothetical protein ACYDC8_15465 [Gammaproteobacteria bacterium]
MVTVTRDAAGRWFASFAVEQSVEALPLTGVAPSPYRQVGYDNQRGSRA